MQETFKESTQFKIIDELEVIRTYWQKFCTLTPAAKSRFFYSPDYLEVASQFEGGSPFVVIGLQDEKTLLWQPSIKRVLPNEYKISGYDLTSAYGFGGTLINEKVLNKTELVKSLGLFKHSLYNRHSIVAELTRLNPFNTNDDILIESEKYAQSKLIHVKDVLYFDLSQSIDTLWKSIHPQKKRYLKKVLAGDFVIESTFDHFEKFETLYTETMKQQSANRYYYFSKQFFNSLKKLGSYANSPLVLRTLFHHSVS